jgi:hypothetical protein
MSISLPSSFPIPHSMSDVRVLIILSLTDP